MCVYAHAFTHTYASAYPVHGLKCVHGKVWWQAGFGFGFAWHHEKLHKLFFWKEHYCWSVRINLHITPAMLMALPEQGAAKGPTFSDTQLWFWLMRRSITEVQVACPLLCLQGQLWKPGCWCREAQALLLCPKCSHGLCVMPVSKGVTFCLKKVLPPKTRCQRRQ